jgi:hypothetical protein
VRKEFCMQIFRRMQDDERFVASVDSTSAGSGAAKIHVPSWNMSVTAQRLTCFAPSAEKECTAPSS